MGETRKEISKERLLWLLGLKRTERRARMAITAARQRLKWAKQRASEESLSGEYLNFSGTYIELANQETMTIRALKKLLPRRDRE